MKDMADRFLTARDLRSLGIHYCNMHLLRLEAARQFPSRIRLTPKVVVWSEREVQAWLAGKVAARNAEIAAIDTAMQAEQQAA